jgi:hypothetical protein
MAYLGEEELRRRIRGIVLAKTGVDCPDLVVHEIMEALGPAVVNYTCKEGENSKDLKLTEEEAQYIGLDRAPRDRPETNQ